jgi:hypothetical protein
MGGVLELAETMKTPAGWIGLVIVIGVVYMLYKWVFAPHPDDDK